jgi:hypothetical protein
MNIRPLPLLFLLACAPLAAQESKPPAAGKKPSVSKEDKAKVNAELKKLKNKEEFKKASDLVDKVLERNKGAEKELQRIKESGTDLTKQDAEKLLDKRQEEMLTPAEKEEWKKLLDAAGGDLKAAAREWREKERAKQGKTAPNPLPEPEAPRPEAFENLPPPAPLAPMRAVQFTEAPMRADTIIKGPERDPRNPDIELPETDLRRRTWIAQGDIRMRLRAQQLALDADEVTLIWKPGSAGFGTREKPKAAGPLRKDRKEPPFERLFAKGRVRLMFVDDFGHVQVGRAGSMIYDQKSGEFILKDSPELQIDNQLILAANKSGVLRMGTRLRDGIWDGGIKVIPLESTLSEADFPSSLATPVPDAGPAQDSTKIP